LAPILTNMGDILSAILTRAGYVLAAVLTRSSDLLPTILPGLCDILVTLLAGLMDAMSPDPPGRLGIDLLTKGRAGQATASGQYGEPAQGSSELFDLLPFHDSSPFHLSARMVETADTAPG
jgi:hypothetical protein